MRPRSHRDLIQVEKRFRAIEVLRDGVRQAIIMLGCGFLTHSNNTGLRERLHGGALDEQAFYRQLLCLTYRLVFLCVAEERTYYRDGVPRGILLRSDASEEMCSHYREAFSIRDLRRRTGDTGSCLYRSLRAVMKALGSETECSALGLVSLGSFLWSQAAVSEIVALDLSDADLIGAMCALLVTPEGEEVDFQTLAGEDLGKVYESLLELHPTIDVEAGSFTLATAWYRRRGLRPAEHARKRTGSYYTPPALIDCVLNAALNPVLEEMASRQDPVSAIMSLRVCDPACGAGHFLIASAHRMARVLASARTGEIDPSACDVRHALHDVIVHCIYGVDKNEMAVELCKMSLWLEAWVPDLPLTFVDAHVVCRNSLIGSATGPADPVYEEQYLPFIDSRIDAGGKHSPDGSADAGSRGFRSRGPQDVEDHWAQIFPDVFLGNLRFLAPPYALKPPRRRKLDPSWRRDSRNGGFQAGGFDVVIGNPPYLRDSRKKDLSAAVLAQLYSSAVSHYDICVLFIELAMRIVRPGGTVGLLTSNGYLRQKYGSQIRRLLLTRRLTHVVEIDYLAFDAGVRTCVTSFRNLPHAAGSRTLVVRAKNEVDLRRLDARSAVPQDALIASNMFSSETVARGVKKHTPDDCVLLEDIAFITLGMVFHDPRPGGKRKDDYLCARRQEPYVSPLVDGEHVERWRSNGRVWLHYVPQEHREPRFTMLFSAAAKLLCRRIVGRSWIMAFVDEEGLFFSDNVVGVVPYHMLVGATQRSVVSKMTDARVSLSQEFDPYYLVALLNSTTLSRHFREVQGADKHFYPAHAKRLPIRRIPPACQAPLAALARRIQAEARGSGKGCPAVQALERELDEIVSALYES